MLSRFKLLPAGRGGPDGASISSAAASRNGSRQCSAVSSCCLQAGVVQVVLGAMNSTAKGQWEALGFRPMPDWELQGCKASARAM